MNRAEKRSRAARIGGLARVRKHGNPGTSDGRKLGGSRSLRAHAYLRTRFKLLRTVSAPVRSPAFAELLGIIAGDGHVDEYQATVTTNSLTDIEHAQYIKKLIESIFPINAGLRARSSCNACVVTISSKDVCRHLVDSGMVRGDKIKGGLSIPAWVIANNSFRKAFIRGLFDTDGCTYVDTHTISERKYRNIGLAFTNHCPALLIGFKESLRWFGFHPTQKTKYVVFLRREAEIRRYFEVIGTSNPKHQRRFFEFLRAKHGGVG